MISSQCPLSPSNDACGTMLDLDGTNEDSFEMRIMLELSQVQQLPYRHAWINPAEITTNKYGI